MAYAVDKTSRFLWVNGQEIGWLALIPGIIGETFHPYSVYRIATSLLISINECTHEMIADNWWIALRRTNIQYVASASLRQHHTFINLRLLHLRGILINLHCRPDLNDWIRRFFSYGYKHIHVTQFTQRFLSLFLIKLWYIRIYFFLMRSISPILLNQFVT